jgi:GNAT superfamily N-acetyltransferase
VIRVREVTSPDDGALGAVASLYTAMERAVIGDDEPAQPVEAAADWLRPPPQRARHTFLALDGDDPVGFALAQRRTGAGIDHLTWVPALYVAPRARRRGAGSALVGAVAAASRADGRHLVCARHALDDGAGAAFADVLGASRAMVGEQNRLRLVDLDRALMERWVADAAQRAAGYDLVAWDDRCPEDLVERFAVARSIMNDAPRPPSAGESHVTADDVRATEQANRDLGTTHWVVAARHTASGDLVGFTEVHVGRNQPWLAHQGDTGVAVEHRERGLGRWLKATNALRLLDERPEVTHVQTMNARGNAPMLSINTEMGFRLAAAWQDRELSLA